MWVWVCYFSKERSPDFSAQKLGWAYLRMRVVCIWLQFFKKGKFSDFEPSYVLGPVHTGCVSTFACKFGANPLMLLASCVNTHIDHNVFHNLHVRVSRCSVSCVNWALDFQARLHTCRGVSYCVRPIAVFFSNFHKGKWTVDQKHDTSIDLRYAWSKNPNPLFTFCGKELTSNVGVCLWEVNFQFGNF